MGPRSALFAAGIFLAGLFIYKPLLGLTVFALWLAWRYLRAGGARVRRLDWADAQSAAQAALDAGDFKKALLLFEKAAWLSPGEAGTSHADLKIELGKARALLGLGRNGEAAGILKAAIAAADRLPGAEAAALAATARGLLKQAAPTPGNDKIVV